MCENELSLNPPYLFGTNGLIQYAHDKSNLTDLIAKKYQPQSLEDRTTLQIERTVIDMGSYLRTRVNFNKGETYKVIIQKLVSIVKMYPNPVAVFDGYNDDSPSTKYMTHLKRLKKVNPSHTVELALNLPFNFNSKTEFFANKRNKQSFINLMSEAMKSNGIEVDHVTGDADQLIAERAIDAAVTETTQVIGEDTDIFQLLISQLIPDSKGLYMITEKQNAKHPILDMKTIRSNLGDECTKFLPVVHAMRGCDTTSELYGIGKGTAMTKYKHIIKEGGAFLNAHATQEQIEVAGRRTICLIYDEKAEHFDLNDIRLKIFE